MRAIANGPTISGQDGWLYEQQQSSRVCAATAAAIHHALAVLQYNASGLQTFQQQQIANLNDTLVRMR